MSRPQSELTKFILSLPANLSTREVVDRAKAAGMTTTPNNVHRVRAMGRKPGKKRGPTVPPVAKAAASAVKPGGASKADFVRGLPRALPAKEVVARAKAAGLSLNEVYVYKVRGRKHGRRRGRPAGGAQPALGAKPLPRTVTGASLTPAAHSSGAEVEFRKLVLNLGVGRARVLLDDVSRRLEALVRGG